MGSLLEGEIHVLQEIHEALYVLADGLVPPRGQSASLQRRAKLPAQSRGRPGALTWMMKVA
jgi:hypothetical protein